MPMPNMSPPTPTIPRPQLTRDATSMYRPSYVSNTMLPGFFVNSENDINGNEIPADGSMSFFPYRDLSRIVVKQWSSPAKLETAVYVLEGLYPQQEQQAQHAPLPAPPPPVVQQPQKPQGQSSQPVAQNVQQQDNALLEGFKQLNNGLAGAFKQLETSLGAINANLEQLNSRFIDGDSVG